MNELVSIIMPSCNTGKYIEASIRSVLSQTYSNWELLIVDDCSSDNTIQVVKEFSDSRIKLFQNEKNSGAAFSRNFALNQAKGKWIAFLDSDDLWRPEKLEKQIRFMHEHPCDFSYTQYDEINRDGTNRHKRVSGPRRITKHGMFRYCWPGCLTVMFNAEKIGLIQIKEIRKHNDYAMWLKICRKADCFLLAEPLAQYRTGRVGSVTSSGYFNLIKWHYRLFRYAEDEPAFLALVHTSRNVFFGFMKKLIYVKHYE